MMMDAFLTTEEVLEYLQVNLRTVYRLIKSGKLPAVRVGRQWRIRQRDLDAWLEAQRTSSSGGRSAAAKAKPRRGRILVVDDEEGIRQLLSELLSSADYHVDVAENGSAAMDRMRQTPYDLLITDLRMPGLDGLEVIREARRLQTQIPVIIVTGYSTADSAIEAIKIGVQGYLTKPFQAQHVLETTARALDLI